MAVTKTPLRAPIRARLGALNDQLQFFLFAQYQFLAALPALSAGREQDFTSTVLPNNPYSPRLHVRLGRLGAFQAQNQALTFGAYFATTYEVASDVFPQALQFLSGATGLSVPTRKREGPEEHFSRALAVNRRPLPSPAVIDTFTFSRFRRNSFIHLGSAPSKAFVAFCSLRGTSVNQYWGATRDGLDFSTPNTGPLEERETSALIKLIRIGVLAIDYHAASLVTEDQAVRHVAAGAFAKERVRMNDFVADARSKKLRALVKHDFGFEPSAPTVDREVRRVGKR